MVVVMMRLTASVTPRLATTPAVQARHQWPPWRWIGPNGASSFYSGGASDVGSRRRPGCCQGLGRLPARVNLTARSASLTALKTVFYFSALSSFRHGVLVK
ncbi:hypothetical protein E2C01_044087 [Portunus trituberculatus]|uniref:Uncharacterized protein n=1 Tax=Portunus trituberculatus TaxID=210409 RepID=A0A5B7FZ02_PORTR|nr:hypothetical protein [Portunus trituberculatus]